MTNAELVARETEVLVMQGKITEEEDIHTYAVWKEMGYQVKKGEHAVTKLLIWKPKKRKKAEGDEPEGRTGMSRTNAAFFSTAQVEPITP